MSKRADSGPFRERGADLRAARAFITASVALLLVSVAQGSAVSAPTNRSGGTLGRTIREILVRFEPDVSRTARGAAHRELGSRRVRRIPGGIEVVRVPPGLSAGAALDRYAADPRVMDVDPNLTRPWASHVPPSPASPNDPLYPAQWGIENLGQSHLIADPPPNTAAGTAGADMNVREAWALEQGDTTPTVVAVIDTGVDVGHEDLAPNLWTNPGEIPGDGIDNDGNGYVDDVHGWNFVANNADLSDPTGHGTHVAGAVAAVAHNGVGVAGVCPHCEIMVLKAGGPLGVRLDAAIAALRYARAMGAHIVNGSYGGGPWSGLERNAIREIGVAGVLAVFSAGNESLDNDLFLTDPSTGFFSPVFPASYDLPNILAVAASDHHDAYGELTGCSNELARWRCAFTNWGRESVDVAAPGTDIVSTLPGGLGAATGTSASAPYAAGAAGLIRSHRPELTPEQVIEAIVRTADRPPAMTTMRSFLFRRERGRFTRSNGRVDVSAALTAAPGDADVPTDGTIRGARRLRSTGRGRVSYPNDVNDVYRKRLRKGVAYEAVLRPARRADLDLRVWKPGTVDVWQVEIGCVVLGGGRCQILGESSRGPGREEIVRFRARRNAIHFFHVHTALGDRGRYRLSVRRR